MMEYYTIEIYREDKRKKEGKRLISKTDIEATTEDAAVERAEGMLTDEKDSFVLHPTYRLVQNIMSGKMVEERYDTPYSCSVGSESYWCN